ncbi:hypothetical protein RH915_11420, partial [Serpentinicella sp. ANB-PHB4]|uniref:hypothetical protein n=1 Tax=Serpentinicella sp. ANB-PHB4 TaxID=3074076 RepID=UPI002866BA09
MKNLRLNEFVFIGIIGATVFILGYILLPFMQMMALPESRGVIVAPVYGTAVTLVLYKTQKKGVISLLGFLIGMMLSMFSIIML